ncbi:MAG: CPBP family intramembrane metalloprotease [Pleurocapsa minor GSE-CHR-MK-17-07R]|nr:CPBP family intramembrane metalloprotease [Pleurocapsa minor GSE-CHR-MK 17-07R]
MTTSRKAPSLMQRIRTLEPAPPWNLTSAMVAILIAMALFILGSIPVGVWAPDQPYALLAGWCLGATATTYFVARTRSKPDQRLALKMQPATPLPVIAFIGFTLALSVDLLAIVVTGQFLPAAELASLVQPTVNSFHWVVAMAFALFLQPIAEGVVFRGLLLPVLRARLGAWPGILVAAAASAVFHIAIYASAYANASNLSSVWYGVVTPFIAAVIFGMVRAATGSTRTAIVAQSAFGLFALVKVIYLISSVPPA